MAKTKNCGSHNRTNYQGMRRFPGGVERSNDTWKTGLNNNDLLIGPSGVGKTRSYVIPNILRSNESFILADTKGAVYDQVAGVLRKRGFIVEKIDFVNPRNSTIGYNPLDFIRRHPDGRPYEQDISKISSMICSVKDHRKEPYWGIASAGAVSSIIAFVMEAMPESLRNLRTVATIAKAINDPQANDPEMLLDRVYDVAKDYDESGEWTMPYQWDSAKQLYKSCLELLGATGYFYRRILQTYSAVHEDSMGQRLYDLALGNYAKSEKTASSIAGIVTSALQGITYNEIAEVFAMDRRLDFRRLGHEKTAVFLTISDTDRSVDKIVNMFYAQAFNVLCESADNDYDGRHMLDIPVRVYLDDFATNVVIPEFDNIISVIRSREIYASIVLQSLSQLDAIYGEAKAATILNNCSTCLYLGGHDIDTATYVGQIADKTENTIMNLPKGKYYLITAGEEAQLLDFTPGE